MTTEGVSPPQLFLEVHHILVTLGIVGCLSLHKVIQTPQVVGLGRRQEAGGTEGGQAGEAENIQG